jgi:hypothetical protein
MDIDYLQFITLNTDSFYESLRENNRQLFEDIRAKMREGKSSLTEMNLLAFNYSSSNYDRWIKDMDNAFATVLRSDEFLSSLSKYVNSVVDLYSIYRQPGGHVGLCISSTAHEKLWPEVTEWILAHS